MARTFKDKKGYKRYSNTGIAVHRIVGAKKIGRPLRKGEVVHHINREKDDNRMENLWVFPGKDGYKKHDKTHRRDKKKFGKW